MNKEGSRPEIFRGLLFGAGAVVFFHLGYSTRFSFLIFGYVLCLMYLGRTLQGRYALYGGFAVGFLCVAPQLGFFWSIFGPPAVALWAILAGWIALYVFLVQMSFARIGPSGTALLAPFLWTALEYFRSEIYFLRFSWLNVGYAFSNVFAFPFRIFGVYGIGFIAIIAAASIVTRQFKWLIVATLIGMILSGLLTPTLSHVMARPKHLQVAGVQTEFPSEDGVIADLDRVTVECPDAQLIVLSEYTFDGPVPPRVRAWCRDRRKYLVAGGKDSAPAGEYYNTAFVVSPEGEIVFKQAKSVPIQFFSDGLPAPEQEVWNSPWGKIGICICYDLSYTRVTDQLVRLGAVALIVPTMDVLEWGRHEHDLHRRIAPVRAAEYGIPIFRLASSGISQLVSRNGEETAAAPFAEKDTIISGEMLLAAESPNRVPMDRFLAPLSIVITAIFIIWLAISRIFSKLHGAFSPPTASSTLYDP